LHHAASISIHRRIIAAQKELAHMGGPVATTRGGMVHTVLRLCCAFEDALTKAIDGGKDGAKHSNAVRMFDSRSSSAQAFQWCTRLPAVHKPSKMWSMDNLRGH
jgi:hypothetical protein